MSETTILILSIIIAVLSLLILAGAIMFGLRIFQQRYPFWPHPFYDLLVERLIQNNKYLQIFVDNLGEFLERRNEFWTTYSQAFISVFLIAVIAILLLTETISAEAGLPILSGVTGFAIAKSATARPGQTQIGPEGPQG